MSLNAIEMLIAQFKLVNLWNAADQALEVPAQTAFHAWNAGQATHCRLDNPIVEHVSAQLLVADMHLAADPQGTQGRRAKVDFAPRPARILGAFQITTVETAFQQLPKSLSEQAREKALGKLIAKSFQVYKISELQPIPGIAEQVVEIERRNPQEVSSDERASSFSTSFCALSGASNQYS